MNLFDNNSNDRGHGGGLGIRIYDLCNINVINNTFLNNSVEPLSGGAGAAIINFCSGSAWPDQTLNIANNIFYNNTAPAGSDLCMQDFDRLLELNLDNNIIKEVLYNLAPMVGMDPTNLNIDPLLNPNFTPDPASPVIDSGLQLTDYDFPVTEYTGNYRLMDGDGDGWITVDRGAIEYRGPGAGPGGPKPYRFLPDIPSSNEKDKIKLPEGPPYYFMIGDISQNSDPNVGWTISNNRYVSSGYSLYYGDPAAINYNTDQKRNSGI